jgi:hypothetical protein
MWLWSRGSMVVRNLLDNGSTKPITLVCEHLFLVTARNESNGVQNRDNWAILSSNYYRFR